MKSNQLSIKQKQQLIGYIQDTKKNKKDKIEKKIIKTNFKKLISIQKHIIQMHYNKY